jgi:hypothetical protein
VTTRGVTKVTIWLNGDMIDQTQPVVVRLNAGTPKDYPRLGKVLAPDLQVLLEDYYDRGDRRRLFWTKLEFPVR